MTLHNAEQLGAAIRLKRREKKLTQADLAGLLGAERKWVLNLESGDSKAEIGLVMRAIGVLGLSAFLTDKAQPEAGSPDLKTTRLDQVFQRLQRGPVQMSELEVVIEGDLIGRVRMNKAGRLSSTTDQDGAIRGTVIRCRSACASPTSPIRTARMAVSLEPAALESQHPAALGPAISCLLSNPFKLLTFVGADVPGAAQFLPASAFAAVRDQPAPSIDWISLDELAQRLGQLRLDAAAVRRPGDRGKMSLPGAQAKTAFCWDEQRHRWGVPSGRARPLHTS